MFIYPGRNYTMKYFPLYLIVGILVLSCSGNQTEQQNTSNGLDTTQRLEFFGNTQGTTFSVICNDKIEITNEEIEEILHQFDLALSAYIPNSVLTKLNEAPAGEFNYVDSFGYFNRCYLLSKQMWQVSEHCFDPTVYPLVDGWGFMKDVEFVPDSAAVDSLRALIGFSDGVNFTFMTKNDTAGNVIPLSKIIKHNSRAKLDFNAIAQGLAVDVIAEEFERRGAQNYFVEIGGEIRVKGLNSDGVLWRVAIDKPIENSSAENREFQDIIQVNNRSVATSGSYRKFYEKDGIKYSHTIDPFTGYPVQHTLLSATVVADDCATADALATAFMVMGTEKSIRFLENNNTLNLDVYLIFTNDKGRTETYMTKGMAEMVTD